MATRRTRKESQLENIQKINFDISSSKKISAKDYFLEYLFPDAIIYGMSYDEFWNEDPQLYFSYRFSYMQRMELEREKQNQYAWLQGFYNTKAFNVVLYNAFKEKNEQPIMYFEKPIDFNELALTDEEKTTKAINIKNKWGSLKSRMKGE